MLLLVFLLPLVLGLCPGGGGDGKRPEGHPGVRRGFNGRARARKPTPGWREAFDKIDFKAVKADLITAMTDSQEFWPADWGHYGGLIVRMAWHMAGSYRMQDGRGGNDGGRMRHDPERSWDDNTNLDKARRLLEPIKKKYGVGLSYADLYTLAGDAAIESMGGPIVGTCLGRFDDPDGFHSIKLGPSLEQDVLYNCKVDGDCQADEGLGPTTIKLIYVNPEGPQGIPDAAKSAEQVRDTFGRMGMNDRETVALVGGGHAFGKQHGACPKGAGNAPNVADILGEDAWQGNCGTGKGADQATSGLEGPWTTRPDTWDNEFYQLLEKYEWFHTKGSGGKTVWWIKGGEGRGMPKTALGSHGGLAERVAMNTGDLALKYDPENIYQGIVKEFANDQAALDKAFSEAWYKLTTRDMGPYERCLGPFTPADPRPFQAPLPAAPEKLADFDAVKALIKTALETRSPAAQALGLEQSDIDGTLTYAPAAIDIAFNSAQTFRQTDFQGGPNGARIRFAPQADFAINAQAPAVLALLKPIIAKTGISIADAIVLAGNAALESTIGLELPFCGGRTDATEGNDSDKYLEPQSNETVPGTRQNAYNLGTTLKEYAALQLGVLLGKGNDAQAILLEPSLQGLVKDKKSFAAIEDYLAHFLDHLEDFQKVWTKLMNIDRFDGPTGNKCPAPERPDCPEKPRPTKPAFTENCKDFNGDEAGCRAAPPSRKGHCAYARKSKKCKATRCMDFTRYKGVKCVQKSRAKGLICHWNPIKEECTGEKPDLECEDLSASKKDCTRIGKTYGCKWKPSGRPPCVGSKSG